MQRFRIVLLAALLSATICRAAPQGDANAATAEADGSGGDEGGDAADLTEATELMTFLKMEVK